MEAAVDLGALLDAGEDAVVTLVAGETRLLAHRAVLSDRSPVFGAMFRHDMREASSGQVTITDVEGPVLRQLLACLYTLQGPQLPGMAAQLIVAADKYGVAGLKAACEQQLAAQLCVETAASAAVLAIRHCCPSLRQAAVAYIKAHQAEVMATRGWADAARLQPEDVDEVNRLLAETSRTQPLGRTASRARRRPRPPPATPPQSLTGESSTMSAVDLGALLDAGEDALVTLVAGNTRLVMHRAVLTARIPMLEAMFAQDMLDVEGPVLRQLVSYLYTLLAPQLIEIDAVTQLLAAADKYGVAGLKADWEQQVAAQLSVETAAAAAVLAVRHSCEFLRRASIRFVKKHTRQVMATRGWADAMGSQPDDITEVKRLLVARMRGLPADERSRRLREAAQQGAVAELQALLEARANVADWDFVTRWTALHHAAWGGHVEVARLLLEAGADVADVDYHRRTALHWAAEGGHAEVARLLLEAGADVADVDNSRMTALHCAAQEGHAEAARLLLEAGADVAAVDNSRMTALHWAAQEGHAETARLLLEAGADVADVDNSRMTALHWAAQEGHAEVARLLLEWGAEVDARDCEQWTPLHQAAYHGHAAVVRLLLAHSADHSTRDEDGMTPLHCTAQRGHTEAAAALLDAGADRAATDDGGMTALDLATWFSQQQLVELLTGD